MWIFHPLVLSAHLAGVFIFEIITIACVHFVGASRLIRSVVSPDADADAEDEWEVIFGGGSATNEVDGLQSQSEQPEVDVARSTQAQSQSVDVDRVCDLAASVLGTEWERVQWSQLDDGAVSSCAPPARTADEMRQSGQEQEFHLSKSIIPAVESGSQPQINSGWLGEARYCDS